jgi:hypothetical protein
MRKVTVTAAPRQGHRGFGAVERYFVSGIPEQLEVTDAQYKELTEDPATFFLKVEDGWKAPEQDEPAKPADPPKGKK